jgi:precorrin-3B synthase
MLTGDGYLVRLRFSCGIVSSEQARALAGLARRYGNGQIDLTRRANLQIRGIAEERIPELQAELLAKNLARDAGSEMTPNVIASPLGGRDHKALLDITPFVQQLEQCLAQDPRTRGLPAKFCIAVGDGSRFSLGHIGADIEAEARQRNGQLCFAVAIGGRAIGFVDTVKLAETALALTAAFASLRTRRPTPARRMRDLIDEVGLSSITASCRALRRASPKSPSAQPGVDGQVKPDRNVVGIVYDDVFGVAAPFGSLAVEQLALLAELADHHAGSELRLTPWRAILIPAIASGAIDRVKSECARAGLITDAFDWRRHVAACTGAPACTSASVNTRELAAALAPRLEPHETLHVSGCRKSCASSASASITLVGRDGRFDLVRDGKAGDRPALFGLSAEDAGIAVRCTAAEDPAHV